ncbi:MAG: peptide ABC transporter substrate-binding protein [Ruminococcus sp.]|nr:peptide ABC transporter substrate-binding protein [Ruminococcus sp.]
MSKKIAAGMLCPVLLLTGCQLPFQKDEGDGSGYLFTYTLTENPDSLDPQIAKNEAAFMVLRNMMQGLVEEQPDGTITYGVSSFYSVTEDGLRYTFTLRDDSYWYHDENRNEAIDEGETWNVTAEDFVFAFQRMFREETKSPYREMFRCLAGAEEIISGKAEPDALGVYAENKNTLVFELAEPCADFLSLLSLPAAMPCNEAFFEQTSGRYGLDEESVISNNGFYLRRWLYDPYGSDNLIYLQENSANNTVQKVYPSDVTFLIRNSQEAAEEAFAAGKADILATPYYKAEYSDAESFTVSSWKSATLGLLLNPDWEAFQNQKIRTALSMAIPRSMFTGETGGDVEGAYGIVPPETRLGTARYSSYLSEPAIRDTANEDALALFQEGLSELGVTSLPSADILMCENMAATEDLYEIVQMWQSLFGFYVGIKTVPESEYNKHLAEQDYVITLCSISGKRNNAASVLETFRTGENDFGFSVKALDTLLAEVTSARDYRELADLCIQAEQIILDEAIFIPVFYKNSYLVHSTRNHDITYDPYSGEIQFRSAKYYEN